MVDYSKWKNIEISDDEDDTHPNIDTASLFRWRHQARIERMEQHAKEKKEVELKKKEVQRKLDELKNQTQTQASSEKTDLLVKELKELELETKKLEEKESELDKAERNAPWNVDTISKESWSKTIINKPLPRVDDRANLSEDEIEKRYQEFVKKHQSKIKEYGMISKFDDCKSFLMANQDLVCEDTSNYMTLWCLNLEIEGKHDLMEHVSKQAISLHYILELSKQMNIDPRGCVSAFFNRIQRADKEYMDAYEDEVNAFQERIRARAKVRLEEAIKEVEEEERQKRLGPGGLDPEEVMESLPEELQKCFLSRDVALLQETILKMDPADARYHMKRCVDSGLWVPAPGEKNLFDDAESEPTPEKKDTE